VNFFSINGGVELMRSYLIFFKHGYIVDGVGWGLAQCLKKHDYLKFCFGYDLQKSRNVKKKTKKKFFKIFDLKVNKKRKRMKMYV